MCTAETLQELDSNLKTAIDVMRNMDFPVTAVASGSELFLRFITFATLDYKVIILCMNIFEYNLYSDSGQTLDY